MRTTERSDARDIERSDVRNREERCAHRMRPRGAMRGGAMHARDREIGPSSDARA